jgi:ribosomal protein L20
MVRRGRHSTKFQSTCKWQYRAGQHQSKDFERLQLNRINSNKDEQQMTY